MSVKNEYLGTGLSSLIVGLADSQAIIRKLLTDAGVEEIDPEAWYDYDWAMALLYKIENEVGRAALLAVGRMVIETAPLPPEVDSIRALMMALDPWFKLHARGPDIGGVICEFEDDHSVTLDWSAKGPCSYCIGILEGACTRFGVKPLVEHSEDGCKDKGDSTCVYHVSW